MSLLAFSQKKLLEFPFDVHFKAMNVSMQLGVSPINLMLSSPDVLVQTPQIVTDSIESAYFFQFNATYQVKQNNIYISLAPKPGNKVKITHIEFCLRFGAVNSGNAGIFISKDKAFVTNTEVWTCGNNKTFNLYKDFVVTLPDNDMCYSESPNDSIRFAFAHGANTQGMYLNNFVVYGIVNDEISAPQPINIDAASIIKTLPDRPSGANTCWLMDSDINWPRNVSNESRFGEMKLGALRYPYGHLADNYLWHTPGEYESVTTTGPKAKVASTNTPYSWTWAVNQSDMSFVKAMSFDEYIAICKRQQIEPLIVVNAQSHFYNGTTVNYEMLKTSAAEWVRYANVVKGYNVKYWQIGNEVDLKSELYFSIPTYTGLFIDFATAMKAVDPTIKVGTGVLMETAWNEDVLNKAGTLCDFISAHNYQRGSKVAPGGYRLWYKDSFILITNSKTNQALLTNKFPHRPEVELHITETNISSGEFPDMSNIDLYKALYWFEMNMNHLALKNVKYTYYWGTHSPWNGEHNIGDIRTLLENSPANTIRPAGRIIQLINTYMKNRWLDVERVNGFLRCYASVSDNGEELSVFLLNKNLYPQKASLNISNFTVSDALVEQITFTGNHYNDTNPEITKIPFTSINEQVLLPPISLTILNYKREIDNTTIVLPDENKIKFHFDGKFLHYKSLPKDAGLIIYSVDGVKVMEKNILTGTNYTDISKLSTGLYLATLQFDQLENTIKISKQ